MSAMVEEVRRELAARGSEENRNGAMRFFKEEIRSHGVKSPEVTALAKRYLPALRKLPKAEVFALCEELWSSGYLEESGVACLWAHAQRRRFEPADFAVFEGWIQNYVSNWAACDTLCNHTVGDFIQAFPQYLPELERFARSPNRWMRRAAAVSLIVPARRGLFLVQVLALADILLMDTDDLVRKGYGWMLKAASQAYEQEVFQYVCDRRDRMPRTALRYAIENMPPELKAVAMGR